jgi:capsid protein
MIKLFGFRLLRDGGEIPRQGPSPANQASVPNRTVKQAKSGYFEALHKDGSRTPVPVRNLDLRHWLLSRNRRELSMLARYLFDNHSLVGYAVEQIANYSTPVTPQSEAVDPDAATAYENYWQTWCEKAEFTGRFDFRTVQELVSIALDCDGDIGITITEDNGFAQVQLIDTYRIDHERASQQEIANKRLSEGVEIDRKGRVVRYWIQESKDGITVDTITLDAAQMLLLYEPTALSQYRGLVGMRRGMNDTRDAQDIKAFEKLAVKFSSSLAAVMEGAETIEENEWGDTTAAGSTMDGDESVAEKSVDWANLLGGEIPTLPEGRKLNLLNTSRPHQNVQNFLDTLAGHFAASLGLPPAFFLDSRLTGPNQRSVIGKAQRRFNKRISTICRMVRWVWVRVIGDAIAKGELPTDPQWHKITFQKPAKMTIDSGREMAQEREDVSAGLMSKREHYANRGLDWKNEHDESFNEDLYIIERCQEISQATGVPVEVILSRYGYGTGAKTAPEPAREPDPSEPEQPEDDEEPEDTEDDDGNEE